MQDCSISSALAMVILQSCTKPPISSIINNYTMARFINKDWLNKHLTYDMDK